MARRGDGIYLRGATWWLDFVHHGQRHVLRIGKGINRTVAKEIAQVKRGEILKGEAGIGRKRKDPTFEEAREAFLAWATTNKKPGTAKDYRGRLQRLGAVFGGRRLSQIDAQALERHKAVQVAAGHRVTANRELALMRALFNRCRDLGLSEIPTPSVKLLREPKGRLRFLTVDEEAQLVAEASEPLRSMILLGIHTGLRLRSEILTLEKKDVSLALGVVTVRSVYAKNGKTRSVPLNGAVRPVLARLIEQAPENPYLFAKGQGRYRSVRNAFDAARDRAKLPDVSPHTLRHTFASRLVMAGVDLRTVEELGGWSSLEMVERYGHVSPGHKAEAVERIAFPNAIPKEEAADSR